MADNEKILDAVEVAKATGKIRKGTNEVTKSIERGEAKLVVFAADVSPKEIVMHIPLLCKEKGIACFEVQSKEELGAAAGVGIATAAVAIVKEGDAKDAVKELIAPVAKKEAAEVKEEPEEEKVEKGKEEKPKGKKEKAAKKK